MGGGDECNVEGGERVSMCVHVCRHMTELSPQPASGFVASGRKQLLWHDWRVVMNTAVFSKAQPPATSCVTSLVPPLPPPTPFTPHPTTTPPTGQVDASQADGSPPDPCA